MRIAHIVWGIFQIGVILKLSYNEAHEFKWTNLVCESLNKSWVVIHNCRLRAVNRNKTTLILNGTILHPANDILAKVQLLKKENGYKPWLYSVNIDVCRFMKKPYNPVAILMFKMFKEFTNINHACPFIGPQIVNGAYLNLKFLPNLLPSGDYQVATNWYFDKRPQFQTKVYFTFKEDL
ncbi:uncharacterized protein LOC135429804 [Drosophila montana]|uniref:uncharacterized protein LOC135429804 n=1 Tax=Drosophila montana TaxID=40370 RepID=UPI00313B42E0